MNMMDLNKMNMMNLNQMNMLMGVMNPQEKGKEISIGLKIQDNKIIYAKCFEKEKASILREKINLNNSNEKINAIALNYRIIDENLTIEENQIYNGSKLYMSSHIINIEFIVSRGNRFLLPLDENCPVGMAIILFIARKIRIPEMIFDVINNRKLHFLYKTFRLDIKDNTPIKEIFKENNISPRVTIIYFE